MNEQEQAKTEIETEKRPYEKPVLIHLSDMIEKTDGIFTSLFRIS